MRAQIDSQSDYSVSDLIKRKQIRRESKSEWSDRMLNPSRSNMSDMDNTNFFVSEGSELKDQFFALLMDDPFRSQEADRLAGQRFVGTAGRKFVLNKQEETKNGVEKIEYEVSTKDFGSAKVEVQTASSQVFLIVHVKQFIPTQHTEILRRLVASRLGYQFGKHFEVEIRCKS